MKKEKTVLAIDTALGNHVALMIGDEIHYPELLPMEEKKRSTVILKIDSLLKKHSLMIKDLSAICVNRGPGSFTGIRIGIAMAKGFARPYDTPIIPVNSFQVISRSVKIDEIHTIMINAGGGFIYLDDSRNLKNCDEKHTAKLINIDSLDKELIEEYVIQYGSGLDRATEKVKSLRPECKIIESSKPVVDAMIGITQELLSKNHSIPYRELKPYYLKPSYADIN